MPNTATLVSLKLPQGVRSSCYAWFTEGFDTADLQGAKALLDALS
jgi:hypothetical protein